MDSIRTRIAPVIAAAAALALSISLVLAGNTPNARAVTAAHPSSPPTVPTYYVALPGADNFGNVPGATKAVVGDTYSGKQLLTVRPSGADKFVSVSAAADDRTFVLGAAPHLQPPAVPMATTWYLVHITPGSRFRATVRKLRIPAPSSDNFVDTTALSPDGREVALIGLHDVPSAPVEWVRIYSVATGALLHAWSGPPNVAWDAYTTLSWTADGRRLAIGYTWYTSSRGYLGVRMLDVTRPGHDLIRDSRLAWSIQTVSTVGQTYPLTCAVDIRALVSADGKTVICSATGVFRAVKGPPDATCPAVTPWNDEGFLEYSTATGKLVRTLYKQDSNCVLDGIDVLWVNSSGDTAIGYFRFGNLLSTKPSVMQFGIVSKGKFTRLPIPPTTTTIPNAIAW